METSIGLKIDSKIIKVDVEGSKPSICPDFVSSILRPLPDFEPSLGLQRP